MKRSSTAAKALSAAAFLLVIPATQGSSAFAAESVFLGQVGKLGLSGTCGDCSVAQVGDTGAATGVLESGPYKAPFSGVLTYFSYRAGKEITTSPADTLRPQVFSLAGGIASVNHEGASHVIQPWPGAPPAGGGIRYFRDRVAISAGEVLGGRFTVKSIAVSGDPTPQIFETSETGDTVRAGTPGSGLGGSFSGTTESKFRVNLLATLEPDADSDGYGDVSQDLCPGSPIGEGACSGSLVGSHMQKEVEFGGTCSLECLVFQKTIGGVSQAAPFDGVVVRWRMLDADSGSYSVRTVSAPMSGEHYIMGPSSAVESYVAAAPPRLMKKSIASFPTRVPIEAGGYVGLVYQTSTHIQKGAGSTGSNYQSVVNSVPDGTNAGGLLSPPSGELLFDADIEPDADHDGYGDVTQDSCPSSASVHAGACPLSSSGGSSKGARLRAKVPTILSAKPGKKGGYEVKVKVGQPGTITAKLTGKLRPKGKAVELGKVAKKVAARNGTYTLTLKPPKAAREAKVRVKLLVTLAPSGYEPAQASKSFKLK